MKNGLSMLLVGAFALSAAGAVTAQQREIGYPDGSLGVEAIFSADYLEAERQLDDFRVSKYDPGRLINLGYVLMKTDRTQAAAEHFEQVLDEENVELILADGRTMRSHDIARLALRTLRSGQ